MLKLSVVVPCYNEEKTILIFYDEIKKVFEGIGNYTYEIIFVNDGSSDETLSLMKQLAAKDPSVKYISFSRNFGKESAMKAGLENSTGDFVCIMDSDLQDPPGLIPTMISFIQEGYDCVATRRVSRVGESRIKSCFARLFYRLINKISDTKIVDGARDFRLMTRQMVHSILEITEYHRFSKGIFSWVGYQTKWLEFENVQRVAGETKWSFIKLFKYAIEGILSFTTLPLKISSYIGLIFSALSLSSILFLFTRKWINPDVAINGWTSTVIVYMLLSGIQLISIGVIGEYLAKTYMEVKKRPAYFIKDTNILPDKEICGKNTH